MNPRRQLTLAVLGGVLGGGLAWYAATRVWWTEVITRAPFPDKTVEHDGTSLAAWVLPLAIVGLAGALALVATRGVARTVVGALVAASGLGVAAGGGYGLAEQPGVWPAATALGGLLVLAAGAAALRSGRTWPHMSSRYERPAKAAPVSDDPAALWNALDRGEDPTSLNIGQKAPGEGSSG
ncbi:hypothetical protein Afil01_01370 [Actinorhabdospora filicis]|uniref:Trp biosynthesis-associated membrane protein n=1 Tax=Actinorhabdospora filicis TaxID=1785913 RepID=A0A9W6SG00_9ACTN|nr:Trp biosynthesis-associated membrane protein [Actinorhabdospora filicis]GLZ75330.1 hypothetical protein Afil01_01370 [Actinorhabdospora filicis]